MDLNFDRQIGQNVRRLRKLRGLTQDQLAARMQVQGRRGEGRSQAEDGRVHAEEGGLR